jgi:predicted lactoylglutathione lyase
MALSFQFKADGSGYKRGLENMRQETKRFASGVKGMLGGAFALTAVVAGLKRIADKFDRIHKLSIRFGASAESIQRLGFAAEQNGASMETMAKAMAQGNRSAQEAANGLKTYTRAFDALNINVEEFKNLNQEEQMYAIADAYRSATNKNQALAAAQQILGRSALELVPLLKLGSEEMKKLSEDITTLTNDQVASFAAANDALNRYKTQITGVVGVFVAHFVRGFQLLVTVGAQAALEITNYFSGTGKILGDVVTGNFKSAARHARQLGRDVNGAMDRIKKAKDDFINDEPSGGGGGGDIPGEDPGKDPGTTQQEKRLKIEREIADEIERQADATRTLQEKTAKAREEWQKLQEKAFESGAGPDATEEEKTAEAQSILDAEKAYTKFSALKRQLDEQEKAEKDAALKKSKDYQEKVNAEAEEDARRRKEEAASKQEEKEKEQLRIKNLRETSMSVSSLAASGLGGNVSAFTADPALSEAKKQSQLLEDIKTSLQPAGGVKSTPEL